MSDSVAGVAADATGVISSTRLSSILRPGLVNGKQDCYEFGREVFKSLARPPSGERGIGEETVGGSLRVGGSAAVFLSNGSRSALYSLRE